MNYYNEFDPYAAQWLRNLIGAGHIAPGIVDERSIKDVKPADLEGYTQCHFFAGIGVWSHALRQSGWPDSRPVWTGSCPCQPFSAAGNGGGVTDERHLWPVWFNLIRKCRPGVIFGEQVESAINHGWLDLVQTDLEGEDYACGAVGLPAGGVGAPHIRQRLWFVAESLHHGNMRIIGDSIGKKSQNQSGGARIGIDEARDSCTVGELANAESVRSGQGFSDRTGGVKRSNSQQGAKSVISNGFDQLAYADSGRHNGRPSTTGQQEGASTGLASGSTSGELADTNGTRSAAWISEPNDGEKRNSGIFDNGSGQKFSAGFRPKNFWVDCDWLPCRDGKARPVEPGTFPLAHGATARVGRLRAYGNAIVPQVAQAFIEAYLES